MRLKSTGAALVMAVALGSASSPAGAATQIVAYTYDAVGRLQTAAYDGETVVTYAYDAAGSLLSIQVTSGLLGVEEEAGGFKLPLTLALHSGHPNPFSGTTALPYDVPNPVHARLEVMDVSGRSIRVLLDENVPAGFHQAFWNGRNARGEPVASGTYFYRFAAGSYVKTGKIILRR